ncbi:MAG: hypothetical protein ACK4E0_17975 [Chitinophagaceae bacterium]
MELEDISASDNSNTTSLVVHPLDTTIILTSLTRTNYTGPALTNSLAKKILFSYFESKDYFTSDNLADSANLTGLDADKLSVTYDTIYTVDLNGNESLDAVISYWLTPRGASGHCWQPHKAVISDTDKGYRITNEEFIPENFAIDSIVTKDHIVTIYGYEHDCGDHEVLRNFRVRIDSESNND